MFGRSREGWEMQELDAASQVTQTPQEFLIRISSYLAPASSLMKSDANMPSSILLSIQKADEFESDQVSLPVSDASRCTESKTCFELI
jgi:hypothetical protein